MNIQRSNETHCRSFSRKGMRQRHIQFIEFGCIYENFVWNVRMCFCMAELYVHERRNNMAMSWTLLESMLISILADGTVAVDAAAAAASAPNRRHLPPNQLHDGAIRCEIDLGLFCMHRNEFEFNFCVSFSFPISSLILSMPVLLLHLYSRSHRVSVRIRFLRAFRCKNS